jgi:RNA polymerase sigma factor (sigma-70 family)
VGLYSVDGLTISKKTVKSGLSKLAAGGDFEKVATKSERKIARVESFSPNNVGEPISELFELEAVSSSEDSNFEAPLSSLEVDDIRIESDLPVTQAVDPDRVAVSDFLSGSDEAFIRLYAKYESPLLLYCKRMLHNDSIAEDAFQEIWTRVFELRRRKSIVIDHFRGLLFRSARNLCLNLIRIEKAHGSNRGELGEANELYVEESATRQTSQREIQSLLLRAINKLPFDQREVFVLHEYSGMSFMDIAEIMNTNEMNVKVRAYRARLRLKKFIQGWLGLGETDDPVSYI